MGCLPAYIYVMVNTRNPGITHNARAKPIMTDSIILSSIRCYPIQFDTYNVKLSHAIASPTVNRILRNITLSDTKYKYTYKVSTSVAQQDYHFLYQILESILLSILDSHLIPHITELSYTILFVIAIIAMLAFIHHYECNQLQFC